MDAEKILLAPQPFDQRAVRTPAAPASSIMRITRAVPPALRMPSAHSVLILCCRCWFRTTDSGVARAAQLSGARHVGSAYDKATNLPATPGSHRSKSPRLPKLGMAMTSPSIGPSVPGLHASMVPLSVRWRGSIRSICVYPLSHPRHVPYCSLRTGTPQSSYIWTAQSMADR